MLSHESYMAVADFIDEAGLTVFSQRVSFEVQRMHDIQLDIRKEETGFLWMKKRKSIITWNGASGPVDIYWEKTCDGGSWFREVECLPFQKLASGPSQGSMDFEYKQYDRFMVCEAGTDITKQGYEDGCSIAVQQLQ
ncbi:MAG: hypothetical protein ACOH5I_09150 [Oligoflexus sp.]